MGWGRWLLLGELGRHLEQQEDIEHVERQLRWRRQASSSMEKRLKRLQRENDELKLYLASALRLLVAKGVVTPEELRAMVAAVDREDGADDGRYGGSLAPAGPA